MLIGWRRGGRPKAPRPCSVLPEVVGRVLQDRVDAVLIVALADEVFHHRVVLLPLLVVTGLIYLYPQYAPREVLVGGGLWPIALAHYVVGILGAVYLIVHIYIATSSPDAGEDFRLMTTGRAGSAEKS